MRTVMDSERETAAQRSASIKRRKEIWEALHPADKSGKTVATLGGPQKVGFASDTAKVAGMSKPSINQHLARAEALGDDLAEVTGNCRNPAFPGDDMGKGLKWSGELAQCDSVVVDGESVHDAGNQLHPEIVILWV